jgi:hypothetical protein
MEAFSDRPTDEAKWFQTEFESAKVSNNYGITAGVNLLDEELESHVRVLKKIGRFRGVRHAHNYTPDWPTVPTNLLLNPKVEEAL